MSLWWVAGGAVVVVAGVFGWSMLAIAKQSDIAMERMARERAQQRHPSTRHLRVVTEHEDET